MNISPNAVSLITQFEGLRLNAYKDSAGVWTIGYGHTRNVTAGQVITHEEALTLLNEDLAEVEKAIHRRVKVTLEQYQFDALASFIFNLGETHFAHSTLLRKLNQHDMEGAAKEFDRWVYARRKKLAGLVRRRAAERRLFEGNVSA